jgi:hypothetical protein
MLEAMSAVPAMLIREADVEAAYLGILGRWPLPEHR